MTSIQSLIFLVLFIVLKQSEGATNSCNQRSYGYNSFVCVCDASYCDSMDDPPLPPRGQFTRVISSRDQYRFHVEYGNLSATQQGDVVIYLSHSYEYQTMKGFGAAFTDAAGLNVASLSSEAQDNLIKSYFAPDGIKYNIGRIPIAGCDFSTRPYSYDDWDGDVTLSNFSLQYEDYNYKIPYIQKAIEISEREILLFGSPWAPPAWMKESGEINGAGGLKPEYWGIYADYLVMFIQAYESFNLTIWGMTPQNEPLTGFDENFPWNTCAWSAEDMRDWIKTNLGPALTAAGFRRVQMMVLDHNRDALPWYPQTILEDPDASQYVDGIAIHWYDDNNVYPDVLSETQALFPDAFLLYTESCEGWSGGNSVELGNWDRAQNYAYNIIDDINHFCTGWVDWNFALDMDGGPNWVDNTVDSPIIVNADADEFYKQPMFYIMGHFSKFIEPGAGKLLTSVEGSGASGVRAAAFHNPDDTDRIVVMNTNEYNIDASIQTHNGEFAYIHMEPKSIESIIVSYN